MTSNSAIYSKTIEEKPLGMKAYGSIPHLPGSRTGPEDHCISVGQAKICTERARDNRDLIVVQEKVDGSCVAITKINGLILPLTRSGWKAASSPFRMHKMFHRWAMQRQDIFQEILEEGERLVGEWLAQAHGTKYNLPGQPFVAFDIMKKHVRKTTEEVKLRLSSYLNYLDFIHIVHVGGPLGIEEALRRVQNDNAFGAIDPVEGVVWRVERGNRVDFLTKYVRPDKIDGCYLPEKYGDVEIWNWVG